MYRLTIPVTPGNPTTEFRTQSGLLLAVGYKRIVIGQRGPYIEFDSIVESNIRVPDSQKWRLTDRTARAYYREYRSIDNAYVKVYYQLKTVQYADYQLHKWYISPRDLYVKGHPVLPDTPESTVVQLSLFS